MSLGILALATGCSKEVINKGDGSSSSASATSTTTINNNYIILPLDAIIGGLPVGNSVCNPMPSYDSEDLHNWNGVHASLSYVPTTNTTQFTSVSSFLAASTSIKTNIFMNDINVPTTYFSRGFEQLNGTALTDNAGNVLTQNFGLQIDTSIRLSSWEKPGLRQFAIISDDGAIMQINQGGGLTPFLNDDGAHPSKMACASSAVWLGHGMNLPIHIDYFQGPKTQIALMLLWRVIPDTYGTGSQDSPILNPASLNDNACGQSGNDTFFLSSSNPATPIPTPLWTQILNDGWEVVPASDYVLPGKYASNPCYGR
jgi:hypothetical protein